MQERRDEGKEGFRTGGIHVWRNTGKEGQDWRDTGKVRCRTGGMQDRGHARLEECRKEGIQKSRDSGDEGFRK